MSVERMTSKSKSDLVSLEGLSVLPLQWVLGAAEELVSCAYNLDCSMHPSSQEKLHHFSEH